MFHIQEMEIFRMSRIMSLALAGTTAIGMMAGSFTPSQAAPMPAVNAGQIAGQPGQVEQVRYRGGGYYGRGYGRRGGGVGGALAAGAALGLIGGALAASAAPRYGYYDRSYYGGGYVYARPVYGYGGGYGYARPVYGYPAYGYDAYGY